MNLQGKRWREGLMAVVLIVAASALIAWELGFLQPNRTLVGLLWILVGVGVLQMAREVWHAFSNRFVSNMILFGLAVLIAVFGRSQDLIAVFPLVSAAAEKVNQSAWVLLFGCVATVIAVARGTLTLGAGVQEFLFASLLVFTFAVFVSTREPQRDNRPRTT